MNHPLITRCKIVGVAAIGFGLVGTIVPLAAFSDRNSVSDRSGVVLELTPVIIALLGHAYLALSGVTLLRGRKPKLFPYFLVIEAAYGVSLIFLLPPLVMVGLQSKIQARWSGDVSFGFILQVISGFPLWGWLLSRNETGS